MGLIRVEECGLLAPDNAVEIRETMRMASRYYNMLIEIERARRAAIRDVEAEYGLREAMDRVEAAKKATEETLAAIKAERIATRKRPRNTPAHGDLKAARLRMKEARDAFQDRLAEVRTRTEPEFNRINALAANVGRQARAACGVYWGTYLLVEDAVDQAIGDTPMWRDGAPCDPDFTRFRGEGSVGAQVQGGRRMDSLATYTYVRIGEVIANERERARWERKRARLGDPTWVPTGGRDHADRRALWLRTGSTESRGPAWTVFPMILSRPIPDDAVLKGVRVTLRRVGTKEEWRAHFTLELPDGHVSEPCGTGAVALHLGWRAVEGRGIRVAVLTGEDGHREEVFLSEGALESLRVADGIESVRDKHFDEARPLLAAALRSLDLSAAPDWMRRAADTMHAWRSPDRLNGFVRRWVAAGAPGGDAPCEAGSAWIDRVPPGPRARLRQDGSLRAAMEAWAYRDHHLLNYAAGQAKGALRMRQDLYRCLAARVARRYGTLVVDDADRAKIAKAKKRPVEDTPAIAAANSNRHIAAVSRLEGAFKDAFTARGGAVVEVPAPYETRTCNACSHVRPEDDGSQVVVTCESCGVEQDRDYNAGNNMLDSWRERPGDAKILVAARTAGNAQERRSPGGKWARSKAAKAARVSEGATAARG